MDTEEEQLHEVIPPVARKLSRLRKARATPDNDCENSEQRAPDEQMQPESIANPSEASLQDLQERHGDGECPPSVEEEAEVAEPVMPEDGKQYWDEEDELEDYFDKASQQNISGSQPSSADNEGEEQSATQGGGSSFEQENGSFDFGDIDADTQRILRDTASRDRLGRSNVEVEVKPISSILDKIKQRQQEAISRAAKLNIISAPTFEEIFAAAQKEKANGKSSAATATAVNLCVGSRGTDGDCSDGNVPECTAANCGGSNSPAAEQAVENVKTPGGPAGMGRNQVAAVQYQLIAGDPGEQNAPATSAEEQAAPLCSDDDDDILEIVSQGSDGVAEANIVDVPSTTKKKKHTAYQSQEIEFEDEVLIDDGYNSEEDVDMEAIEASSESSSSEEEEDGEEDESLLGKDGEVSTSDAEKETESSSRSEDMPEGQPHSQKAGVQGWHSKASEAQLANAEQLHTDKGEAGAVAGPIPRKKEPKIKPMFLDMEAELSDEDEGAHHSDDEEDDDVDNQGELVMQLAEVRIKRVHMFVLQADLIGTAKETRKDRRKREELHRQWAEQRDAKELQQVLKGLKQGFRRRGRGGILDDEDEEEGGRRRRARVDEEEDAGMDDGGVPWFQDAIGSDEDAEDLELLKRAQQQRVLEESSKEEFAHSGSIPLDENSQEVLSLLARSASEPQVPQVLPRFRFASAGPVLGSALSAAGSGAGSSRLGRGLSFVGRQPSVQRLHSGSLAAVGSRSFVFGRDDSNSAFATDKTQAAPSESQDPDAPTSFANLKQLTGTGVAGSSGTSNKGGKLAGSRLVSRLAAPKQGAGKQQPGGSKSNGADAASAVFQQIVNRK